MFFQNVHSLGIVGATLFLIKLHRKYFKDLMGVLCSLQLKYRPVRW